MTPLRLIMGSNGSFTLRLNLPLSIDTSFNSLDCAGFASLTSVNRAADLPNLGERQRA
jgi:hypothetical protein